MNILYISREFPPSKRSAGIGTYVREISTGMTKLGHKVYVISASDDIFKEYTETIDEVTVYRIKGGDFFIHKNLGGKFISKFRSIFNYNSYRKKVLKKIIEISKEINIDIIEIAEFGNEGKYWLRQKTIPTIIRFHGPSALNRSSVNFEFKNKKEFHELSDALYADALSFVSNSMKEIILNENKIKPAINKYQGKIAIIPNSIEIQSIENTKKNSPDIIKILGAGTIIKEKGWGELVEACIQLKQENYPIELKIYGRFSTWGKKLKEKIEKSNVLSSFIELPGSVDKISLYNYYAHADICCFPSWFEPFGLTVIEAMAQSSIVIASNSGGGKEIIENGINGFLITPKSSNRLKNAIKQIIDLPEDSKNLIRTKAKKTVQENFSNEVILLQVEKFYKDVINSSNGKK
jgi:glycosyltransferase involved in cell wall biosynthesis